MIEEITYKDAANAPELELTKNGVAFTPEELGSITRWLLILDDKAEQQYTLDSNNASDIGVFDASSGSYVRLNLGLSNINPGRYSALLAINSPDYPEVTYAKGLLVGFFTLTREEV